MKLRKLISSILLLLIFSQAESQVTCGAVPFTVVINETSPITCFGYCNGELTVNVTGGVGPFQYQWVGGPTTQTYSNLCAGTYTVIVFDMGQGVACTANDNLTEPSELLVATNASTASCPTCCDGSLVGTAMGGTPPYTGQWYDAATGNPVGSGFFVNNVCPGNYIFCVIDGNGCTSCDTTAVTYTDPCAGIFNVITTTNAAICGSCNGNACVQVSGGSPPYVYLWNDPLSQTTACASGLCAGIYCVTITDASGCDTTVCVTINSTSGNANIVHTQVDPSCNGSCDGYVALSVTGTYPPFTYSIDGGVTYQASPNFSGLCAGVYVFYVQDSYGCTFVYTVVLNAPPAITVNATSTPANSGNDGTVSASFSGGTQPYTFNWYDSAGNPSDTVNLTPGSYYIVVTDANGCTGSDTVEVDGPTGITELYGKEVYLFPNPAVETVTLEFPVPVTGTIRVYNAIGEEIITVPVSGNRKTIEVKNLSDGIYFVQTRLEEKIYVDKLVIRKQ